MTRDRAHVIVYAACLVAVLVALVVEMLRARRRPRPTAEQVRCGMAALAALKRLGIYADDPWPEGEGGWIVTLEPHGEEPCATVQEALSLLLAAAEHDGRRLERVRILGR